MKSIFMEKKKIIIAVIIVIVIIIAIISVKFSKSTYKISNIGNNTDINLDDVDKYIYSINSYEAKIEVEVNSNKNSNKYIIKQTHMPNEDIQEIIEPNNINGIKMIYKDNKLEIKNAKLNITKMYDNYPYIVSNNLWLNSFIEEYKISNSKKVDEENNEIIITITCEKNVQNVKYKKLYIDKNNGKPSKMLLLDNSKNTIIYILYNEITLN